MRKEELQRHKDFFLLFVSFVSLWFFAPKGETYMSRHRLFGFCTVLLWIFFWNAQPIWADDTVDLQRTRIARISLLEGDLTIQHANSSDYESGLLNLPVITGDLIYTGYSGRAELQIQGAFIRLDENTSLEFVEL